jgi:hypothetical protein
LHGLLLAFPDFFDQSYVGFLELIHAVENVILIAIYPVVIIAQRSGKGDSPRSLEFVTVAGKYFVSGAP